MKVALTGHRPERLNLPSYETSEEWSKIGNWLKSTLTELQSDDDTLDAYCGMATGCDVLFGFIVSQIPKSYLHCILPCKGYNRTHFLYERLKEVADEWVELSDEFYKGCDNVRDQYMVDHADVLIAIWDGIKSGGVWSTIRKAEKRGIKIIYIPQEILKGDD